MGDNPRVRSTLMLEATPHPGSDRVRGALLDCFPALCLSCAPRPPNEATFLPPHLQDTRDCTQHSLLAWLSFQKVGGEGVTLFPWGTLLALNPSGNFLGQGINDPTLYVFKDRVRVLVPVEGDGPPIELLQLSGIPVEQVRSELDLLFGILWALQETGLDFHGRRWLVHEVVPARGGEAGDPWSSSEDRGERGPLSYCQASRSPSAPPPNIYSALAVCTPSAGPGSRRETQSIGPAQERRMQINNRTEYSNIPRAKSLSFCHSLPFFFLLFFLPNNIYQLLCMPGTHLLLTTQWQARQLPLASWSSQSDGGWDIITPSVSRDDRKCHRHCWRDPRGMAA